MAYQVDDKYLDRSLIRSSDYPRFSWRPNRYQLTSLVFRLKYTIDIPFYSFIQPYAGYQIKSAHSSGAGTGEITAQQQEEELDLVEGLQSKQFIFGITILKRLVPGWFARLDLGSDALNFGFSLEF